MSSIIMLLDVLGALDINIQNKGDWAKLNYYFELVSVLLG